MGARARLLAIAAGIALAACGQGPATTPPTAPPAVSPSPPATRSLLAVWTNLYPSAAPELRIVTLEGATIATLALPVDSDRTFSAGGDRVLHLDRAGHLWAFRADGSHTDLGLLHAPSYPATSSRTMLTARAGSFASSPTGELAWSTWLPGPPGRWQPMSYIDVFLNDRSGRPVQVHHELSEAYPVIYGWTARGPLFFMHPIADLPQPFIAIFPPLYLADATTHTTSVVWDAGEPCATQDVAADGAVGCVRVERSDATERWFAVFRRGGVEQSVDLGSDVTGAVVRFPRDAIPGEALVGIARGRYPSWSYETRVVDLATGVTARGPFPGLRPAATPWLADGSLLLEGPDGVYVVPPAGQPRLVLGGSYSVIGVITG